MWTKSAGAGQTIPLGVGNNLYFGNGVDQKKWVQSLTSWTASTAYSVSNLQTYLIDPNGNLQQLTSTIVPIANVQIAANVLTITRSGTTDLTTVLSVGLQTSFSGLTTNTFLNGQTVTILTVTASTFTAAFTHANVNTADTGIASVVQGGTPITGTVQPTWNVTLFGTTNDDTAQWTNRGNPVENWGISILTATAPTVNVGASNTSWQQNTFYSNDQVIVDTNGGLQSVTTAGTSGTTAPAWQAAGAGVSTTTNDGTVVWTKLQTAASLIWSAHTAYANGAFVIGNAGGTNCLFKASAAQLPYVTGTISVDQWADTSNGGFNKFFPSSGPASTFTAASLVWNPPELTGVADPNTTLNIATLNAAGEITGYTNTGFYETQEYAITGTFQIPVAGQYTFNIVHDDGMFWAIGDGAQKISGTLIDGFNHTQTAKLGFTQVSGNNNSAQSQPGWSDTSVWNFPTAGAYRFEIDYTNWRHEQTMVVTCNGNRLLTTATPTSGTNQPIWPAFSTSFAPKYPTITEALGQLVWTNVGPADPAGVWRLRLAFQDAVPDQNRINDY